MAIPHPLRRSAWAIRATMTDVECFSLLAVLVYVADEHPALKASAWPFEASVVRLYSVVVILAGWVRVGCARLCGVHRAPSLWAGLREMCRLRGAISLFLATTLYYNDLQTSTNVLRYLL
jgi:hypothetical protein